MEEEKRLIFAQEITDLRCKFDYSVRFLGFLCQPGSIDRGYNS
jgi:hypothetical protein